MNLYQYIDQNIDQIKYEVRIGIIPCSIIKHYQIYRMFTLNRNLGNPIGIAVMITAVDFRVSEPTIYRIIKQMESEL
jgi:hypothetical protein